MLTENRVVLPCFKPRFRITARFESLLLLRTTRGFTYRKSIGSAALQAAISHNSAVRAAAVEYNERLYSPKIELFCRASNRASHNSAV
ncbi:MAG: hypothetical protein MSH49_09415 [[Eubacterium] saphenum]|nr:hypothetical protein [[Eubacterium] saphenum]